MNFVVFRNGGCYHLARPDGTAACNVGGALGAHGRPLSDDERIARRLSLCWICERKMGRRESHPRDETTRTARESLQTEGDSAR